MGNEHEVLRLIRDAMAGQFEIFSDILTENDIEIYIDDYVFRVHVEGDINA